MTSLCFNLPKSKFQIIVTISLNSPDGPVVKNPPSSAGGSGLIPGQGMKIQHAVQPKKKKKGQGFNTISTWAAPSVLGGQVRLIPVERIVFLLSILLILTLALHFRVGRLRCSALECTFLRGPEHSGWIPG